MKMIVNLQGLTNELKVFKNSIEKLSKDNNTYVDREKFLVVLEFHTPNTYSHSESYCILFLLALFLDIEESIYRNEAIKLS